MATHDPNPTTYGLCPGRREEQTLSLSSNGSDSSNVVDSSRFNLQGLTLDEEAMLLINQIDMDDPAAGVGRVILTGRFPLGAELEGLHWLVKRDETELHSIEKRDKAEKLLPSDTFSFLALARSDSEPHSHLCFRYFVTVGVFVLQMFTFAMLLWDVGGSRHKEGRFLLPAGVDGPVRISQLIALIITVISQDEVRQSLNVLYRGYPPKTFPHHKFVPASKEFLMPSPLNWSFSIIFRLMAGLSGLAVTFMLLITQVFVRELLLNFTAVEFVSHVDNTISMLLKWGYCGGILEDEANTIENTKWDEEASSNGTLEARTKRQASIQGRKPHPAQVQETSIVCPVKFPRTLIQFVIFLVLVFFWALVAYRQETGYYLCSKTIFVQFDDDFNPSLGTFSGIYEMEQRPGMEVFEDWFVGRRLDFFLKGPERYDRSAKFSYCSQKSAWVFIYSETATELPDPCTEKTIRAESSETAAYDLSDSALSSWFVRDRGNNELVPMLHFSMKCREGFLGKECSKQEDCGDRYMCKDGDCQFPDPCEALEINRTDITERVTGFIVENRTWSSYFEPFALARVHGRPMFIGNETQRDESGVIRSEVLFFTGRRWALAHTGKFDELKNDPDINNHSIAEFMTRNFHAHWSHYSVAFISEPVDIDTPLDSPSPAKMRWYHATEKRSNSLIVQSPDPDRPSNARFLCAICDVQSNPCWFNNTCRDGTCDCVTGSKGRLCQIKPVGDGKCNPFFNTLEYNYDGGDCCPLTCTSTTQNVCGMADSVDYPNCIDPDELCDDPCWRPWLDQLGSKEGALAGASVVFSRNGAVLAVYEPGAGRVLIFQQSGSEWVLRGSPLMREPHNVTYAQTQLSSVVSLSGDGNVVALGRPPVDGASESVEVFRWSPSNNTWVQLGESIPDRWSVALSSNGTVLATGKTTRNGDGVLHNITLHRYQGRGWSRLEPNADILVEGDNTSSSLFGCSLSLSDEGDILAAGSLVYGRRYTPPSGWVWIPFVGPPELPMNACSVAMSGNGTIIAYSMRSEAKVRIYEYDHISATWMQMGSDIENWIDLSAPAQGGSASLSWYDKVLAVGDSARSSVWVYNYNSASMSWLQTGPILQGAEGDGTGSSVSLTGRGTTLAYGAPYHHVDTLGIARVVWNPLGYVW